MSINANYEMEAPPPPIVMNTNSDAELFKNTVDIVCFIGSMIPTVNEYTSTARILEGSCQIAGGCCNYNQELILDGISSMFVGLIEATWPLGIFYHGLEAIREFRDVNHHNA